MALRRLAHLEITAHGFRSSSRDWATDRTHAPNHVFEAGPAHAVEAQVEAAYRGTDLSEQRRELMET
jgi:hypothetical protein